MVTIVAIEKFVSIYECQFIRVERTCQKRRAKLLYLLDL